MHEPRGRMTKDGIRIYEDADFAGMRAAGRLAAQILDEVAPLVFPGITTAVLDDFIRDRVTSNWRGFGHHWLSWLSTRQLHFGQPCRLPSAFRRRPSC